MEKTYKEALLSIDKLMFDSKQNKMARVCIYKIYLVNISK